MNIQTIHTKNLRWIDLNKPGAPEIDWLRENFHFDDLHIGAAAEAQLHPHIDVGEGYDFLVLLFPVYHRDTQEISSGEVDFFVGPNFLITVHYGEIYTLQSFFSKVRGDQATRATLMQKGSGFLLYKVLESLFRRSYPILDHMTADVAQIERRLFHEHDLNLLSKISLLRKNIIEFRRMMKTHRTVLEKLPKRTVEYLLFPQSRLYYKDLLEYSDNIWTILETLKETADTLYDTHQALATHRLNAVTRVISIFSATVIPASLVAFWFAARVDGIPFANNPFGFWIVGSLMVITSGICLLIFKLKKWL